jgi:AcrR family transcriptional regulator
MLHQLKWHSSIGTVTARHKDRPKDLAKPRRERRRQENESEILDAAEALFAARGFERATMADLARASRFALGTLYNTLGSKEEILHRVLARHLTAMRAEANDAEARAKTPRDKLAARILARVHYLARHRAFFALYVSKVPGHSTVPSGKLGGEVLASVRWDLARTSRLFRAHRAGGCDAATRALLFYGATRAFVVERVLRSAKPPTDGEVLSAVHALLDGLM